MKKKQNSFIPKISHCNNTINEISIFIEPYVEIIKSVEVIDMAGRTVKKYHNLLNGACISGCHFTPGLYLIKICVNSTVMIRHINLT